MYYVYKCWLYLQIIIIKCHYQYTSNTCAKDNVFTAYSNKNFAYTTLIYRYMLSHLFLLGIKRDHRFMFNLYKYITLKLPIDGTVQKHTRFF